MSIEVSWVPTSHEAYACIYIRHQNELGVFGTHTCHDGQCVVHGETYVLTEWGFRDSATPLIRSIRDGAKLSYWIASVREVSDG